MPAYYNEIDPFAAEWLRVLIKAGHIAPGEVDTRSIEDVVPSDLAGFTQCHFFAGIGVWSYALRLAGWPDDRPVWTGSCPCQPFSSAGKGNGFADERHLWPAFHHLIRVCRPPVVFGEQVASKDGLAWLDLVQADMEGEGYSCGAVDSCSAGFGAPHIRQRLYWVADAANGRREYESCSRPASVLAEMVRKGKSGLESSDCSASSCGVGNTPSSGLERQSCPERGEFGEDGQTPSRCTACRMADDQRQGFQISQRVGGLPGEEIRAGQGEAVVRTGVRAVGGLADSEGGGRREEQPNVRWCDAGTGAGQAGVSSGGVNPRWMADSEHLGHRGQETNETEQSRNGERDRVPNRGPSGLCGPSTDPTNGFWRDADWLLCRDGKWRPVVATHVALVDGPSSGMVRVCHEGADQEKEEVVHEHLHPLRQGTGSETLLQRGSGVSVDAGPQEVLRQDVHGGAHEERNMLQPEPQQDEGGQYSGGHLRDMRSDGGSASSPCGREPAEQCAVKLEDVVPLLSPSLSLAELYGDRRTAEALRSLRQAICEKGFVRGASEPIEKVWASLGEEEKNSIRLGFDASRWRKLVAFPLENNAINRVGRLRGYGNAINAQQAKEFITAYMATTLEGETE